MAFPRTLTRLAVLLGLAGSDGAVLPDAELRAPAVPPRVVVMLPDGIDRGGRVDLEELAAQTSSPLLASALDALAAVPPEPVSEPDPEPGAEELSLVELRAAAMLVAGGSVDRVTLAGFRVWPGLLAESMAISQETGVRVVPAVARTGGRVDLIVTGGDGAVG